MKERKLKITYKIQDNGEIDEKLEKELAKILKRFGWLWEGQGYDFQTRIRDLGFYRG